MGSVLELLGYDQHNLELKTLFPISGKAIEGKVDLYLFVPTSLHLREWGKSDLMSDFRSRVRISTPYSEISEYNLILRELSRLQGLLDYYAFDVGDDPILRRKQDNKIFFGCKHLGALFGELLKNEASNVTKYSNIEAQRRIEEVYMYLNIARKTFLCDRGKGFEPLKLIDQYLSRVFVEFLSAVRGALYNSPELLSLLDRIKRMESEIQEERGGSAKDDVEREQYLLNPSQLKKFLSESYIDINQKETVKRIAEPLRSFFHKLFAPKFLPDLHRVLRAEGELIGRVKDWYVVLKEKQLSEELRAMRNSMGSNESEKNGSEDVLHYRKEFVLNFRRSLSIQDSDVNEILRINIERYLKHMDNGHHIHALVTARKASRNQKDSAFDYTGLYRIVADKSGIARVELLSNRSVL